jgi:guanylate kinase
MASILRKNSSIEDKVNRLASIDYEVQNASLCDYIINFDEYDDAVAQLTEILGK